MTKNYILDVTPYMEKPKAVSKPLKKKNIVKIARKSHGVMGVFFR